MKHTATLSFDREALYAKSQVYIRRGFRAQADNDTQEYQLWASLALELLGKAALANVHPALIADPNHSDSLFAACGRSISLDVKTITAKTVFDRLRHIDKAFDAGYKKFCEQMALRRNAELHSGESPFLGMASDVWEREFWGAAEVILRMQDQTLETWLGAEDAKTPEKIIEQADEAMQWAIRNRITRCKADFEEKYPTLKRRQEVIDSVVQMRWADHFLFDGHIREKCPACGSSGFLGGALWDEEVIDTDPGIPESEDYGGEPPTETVKKTFSSDVFVCPNCSLELYDTREMAAAELGEDFSIEEVREREYEEDYGND